ncbi:MAG: MBL fold metallo-hydrolase [Fretibacterium sp.]|nr:MBL fold metallo-hydrolase [Fretibacterium sp.]
MKYKRFPLGALWTNGYLFWDEAGRAFFIDPGGDVGEVLAFIKEHELELKAVLLTHGHLDHLSGIEGFLPLVGDAVYIAEGDAALLRRPPEAMQVSLRMRCSGVEHFRLVQDEDLLEIGDFKVKVLATPGHTPGGVCYLIMWGTQSVLASGDTLFAQSVGRTDLPGGDQFTLDESLRRLSALPDDLSVLPGHGPETTIGQERQHNPFWPL